MANAEVMLVVDDGVCGWLIADGPQIVRSKGWREFLPAAWGNQYCRSTGWFWQYGPLQHDCANNIADFGYPWQQPSVFSLEWIIA